MATIECWPTPSVERVKLPVPVRVVPDVLGVSVTLGASVVVVPPKVSAMLTVPVRLPVPVPVVTATVKVTC